MEALELKKLHCITVWAKYSLASSTPLHKGFGEIQHTYISMSLNDVYYLLLLKNGMQEYKLIVQLKIINLKMK